MMKQKLISFLKQTAKVLSLAVLVSLLMNWFFTPLPEDMQVLVFLIVLAASIGVITYRSKN
jgi:hypothetical protein